MTDIPPDSSPHNTRAAGRGNSSGNGSDKGKAGELPPFPIPRWVLWLLAFALVMPPVYVLSFAPAAVIMNVGIEGRSRIKRVEITPPGSAAASRYLTLYGPVVYTVNEVPILYPSFMSWARTWGVDLIEYQ